jgi:hypothetical protein
MRKSHVRREPRSRSHNAPLVMLPSCDDQQVLRFKDWCRLNGISERTGRRILASPDGPVVTKLSAKLIGITWGANRRWQEARTRA